MRVCIRLIILSPVTCTCHLSQTDSIGEESVLVSNLLNGYNKHVKPTRQKTTAINVTVTFSLSQIIDIVRYKTILYASLANDSRAIKSHD